MVEFWGVSEGAARLTVFIAVFGLMALLELVIPKRRLKWSKARRWLTNILYTGINTVVIRLMGLFAVPLVAMAAAAYTADQGYGFFNLVDWPFWVEFVLALIILDMAIYFQHWASHKIPMLWSFHQVHHSDTDIDVSTAIRFHPIEIALSMLYKIVLVFLIGPAVMAVIVFEMILNGCAGFNHANVALPKWLDSFLRLFLVTPDMHRVHHSIIENETNSNYGFSISLWDRLFGTYVAQPKMTHDGMTIGLAYYQSEKPSNWFWTIALPFKGASARHTDVSTLSEVPEEKPDRPEEERDVSTQS